jgi:dienelactone hydrolase
MKTLLQALCAVLLSALAGAACAQSGPGNLMANAKGYTAIRIEGEARESIGTFSQLSNATFKPAGDGPFPAAVVVHTCGGPSHAHIREHAQELLKAGYVVFVQDSHVQRGIRSCRERALPFAVGVMDAYAALRHLAGLPFVDRQRIYIAGYSFGGFVAQMASSADSARVFESPLRFRAAVSNYGNCVRPSGNHTLLGDVDRPLLLLLGDADTEAPAATCFPLAETLRAAGAPVEWHRYPDATHGWDKQGFGADGYRYDAAVSADATRRMLEFFERQR